MIAHYLYSNGAEWVDEKSCQESIHHISSLVSQGPIKVIWQINHIVILDSSSLSSVLRLLHFKAFSSEVRLNKHSRDTYLVSSLNCNSVNNLARVIRREEVGE